MMNTVKNISSAASFTMQCTFSRLTRTVNHCLTTTSIKPSFVLDFFTPPPSLPSLAEYLHVHIHTRTHTRTHTVQPGQIFWQASLQCESSRTHQQIDGSQCVIGCEKRRGQLIHPIISLAVAIETDAYGNTAKGGEGGERGREKKEVMRYCGRGVYLYMYCTNMCVCVCV